MRRIKFYRSRYFPARSSAVRLLGCAAAALVLMSSPPVRANVTWTLATTGDWSIASNWSGGAVPTSSGTADIFNGGTATVTTTGDVCSSLSLGNSAGSGTIQTTGGSLAVSGTTVTSGYLAVGYSGRGNFTQSGGTTSVSNELERRPRFREHGSLRP